MTPLCTSLVEVIKFYFKTKSPTHLLFSVDLYILVLHCYSNTLDTHYVIKSTISIDCIGCIIKLIFTLLRSIRLFRDCNSKFYQIFFLFSLSILCSKYLLSPCVYKSILFVLILQFFNKLRTVSASSFY